MELIVNGDVQESPLSKEVIAKAIRSLAREGDCFAILAKSDLSYIQTSGSPSMGFILECQDGSIEEHFSCTASELGTDQVIEAFQRYFMGDNRWRIDMTWTRVDPGSPPSPVSTRTILILASIVVLLVICWYVYAA